MASSSLISARAQPPRLWPRICEADCEIVAGRYLMPPMGDLPFWKTKGLADMTPAEWESLCDGCGKCCLMKLEYEDSGEIDWTNVACRQLDHKSCRCKAYRLRRVLVEDCVSLTQDNVGQITWLPAT